MVPAGFLLKRVTAPPGWLRSAPITDVCSVADCVNDNVVDLQTAWLHNGFGVANDVPSLLQAASDAGASTVDSKLFYYEAYEQEIETDGWSFDPSAWRPLTPAPSAGVETAVVPPEATWLTTLIGYDVVVFGRCNSRSALRSCVRCQRAASAGKEADEQMPPNAGEDSCRDGLPAPPRWCRDPLPLQSSDGTTLARPLVGRAGNVHAMSLLHSKAMPRRQVHLKSAVCATQPLVARS